MKVRYSANPQPVRLVVEADRVKVIFKEEIGGIAPGQAAVFYQDDLVLGGGTIVSSF